MSRGLLPSLLVLACSVAATQMTAAPTAAQGNGSSTPSINESALLGDPSGPPIQGQELKERTLALASRMRCPVCQGLSVADSPSSSATAMLAQVRDLLADGYSEEQILDYFVRSYGEFVLLQPKAQGFNLVVWLAPALALFLGVLLVARRLRSSGTEGSDDQDPGESLELDEYLERVRTEVRS